MGSIRTCLPLGSHNRSRWRLGEEHAPQDRGRSNFVVQGEVDGKWHSSFATRLRDHRRQPPDRIREKVGLGGVGRPADGLPEHLSADAGRRLDGALELFADGTRAKLRCGAEEAQNMFEELGGVENVAFSLEFTRPHAMDDGDVAVDCRLVGRTRRMRAHWSLLKEAQLQAVEVLRDPTVRDHLPQKCVAGKVVHFRVSMRGERARGRPGILRAGDAFWPRTESRMVRGVGAPRQTPNGYLQLVARGLVAAPQRHQQALEAEIGEVVPRLESDVEPEWDVRPKWDLKKGVPAIPTSGVFNSIVEAHPSSWVSGSSSTVLQSRWEKSHGTVRTSSISPAWIPFVVAGRHFCWWNSNVDRIFPPRWFRPNRQQPPTCRDAIERGDSQGEVAVQLSWLRWEDRASPGRLCRGAM